MLRFKSISDWNSKARLVEVCWLWIEAGNSRSCTSLKLYYCSSVDHLSLIFFQVFDPSKS